MCLERKTDKRVIDRYRYLTPWLTILVLARLEELRMLHDGRSGSTGSSRLRERKRRGERKIAPVNIVLLRGAGAGAGVD
jgi:hypothetical protein